MTVADPDPALAFLTPGSAMGKSLDRAYGSAINIPDHISKSLVTFIWIKNA
jgi:hypothetical protein